MDVEVQHLAHGERRRDRIARNRRRKGTGRVTKLAKFGVKKSAKKSLAKSAYGFNDLDAFWNDLSGDDEDNKNASTVNDVSVSDVSIGSPGDMEDFSPGSKENQQTQLRSAMKGKSPRPAVPTPKSLKFETAADDQMSGPEMDDFGDGMDDFAEDDFEEDTKHNTSKPASAKKKIKSPRRKSTRSKAIRRQTLMIVKEAKESGLADEFMEREGVRRSRRRRTEPLKWWEGEHTTYERRQSGVGTFLPTPLSPSAVKSEENLFVDLSSLEKKRKRKRGGGKRKKKTKKAKKEEPESESEESAAEEEDINSRAWVRDSEEDKDVYMSVAKTKSMIEMACLRQDSCPADLPDSKLPKAGKWFEFDSFCTGVLTLPPGATKLEEVSLSTEVFYIQKAAAKSLEVKIGYNSKFLMSKGGHFFVPRGNVYELRNLSKDKEIKLNFCLVRPQKE